MIRNRLKELMVERGLKASRVANDIKSLSRNTINSTANNNGKMIQLETINLLCQYLGVTPAEFFEYLPFDVSVVVNSDNETKSNFNLNDEIVVDPFYLNLYISKESNNQSAGMIRKTFELSIISEKPIKFHLDDRDNCLHPNITNFTVVLGNPPVDNENEQQINEFGNFWNNELTPGFQDSIRTQISEAITSYFNKEVAPTTTQWIAWDAFPFLLKLRFDKIEKDYSKLKAGIRIHNVEQITPDDLPF